MPQHDSDIREADRKQGGALLQIFCVIALVVVALSDGLWHLEVPSIVYYLLGAGILGTDGIIRLMPGGGKK